MQIVRSPFESIQPPWPDLHHPSQKSPCHIVEIITGPHPGAQKETCHNVAMAPLPPGDPARTTRPETAEARGHHRINPAIGLLACPICRATLSRMAGQLGCPTGHRFDLARQGYVNLTGRAAPANADTAEMLAARERFLHAGYYQPLAEALATLTESAGTIVECGAGTGYYLSSCLATAASTDRLVPHLATDISPAAARRCAVHGLAAAVADTWGRLPIRDGVADVVLCVFAPRNPEEFARILRPGGQVLVTTPREEHLAEMRREGHLLEIGQDKLTRLGGRFGPAGFQMTHSVTIDHPLHLPADAMRDLVAMGPNAFHPERVTGAGTSASTTRFSVTLSVWVHDRTDQAERC